MFNTKELRRKRHMSQMQLARLLNTTQNAISRYESGESEPSFDIVRKCSEIFGVSSDYLLGSETAEVEPQTNIDSALAAMLCDLDDV